MWRSWANCEIEQTNNSIGESFFLAVGYPNTLDHSTERPRTSLDLLSSLSIFIHDFQSYTYHVIGLPGSGKTISVMYFVQESLQDWFVVWFTLGVEYTYVCVQSQERRYSVKLGSNKNIPEILKSILGAEYDGSAKRMIIIDGWDDSAGICKELGPILEDWLRDRSATHRLVLIYTNCQRTTRIEHTRVHNASLFDYIRNNLLTQAECSPCLNLFNHGIETGKTCSPDSTWMEQLAINKIFYSGDNSNFFFHVSINEIIKKIRRSISQFTGWQNVTLEETFFSANRVRCDWSADTAYLFRGSQSCYARSMRPTIVSQFAALEFARVHGSKVVEEMYMLMRRLGEISMNGWWQEMWILGSLFHGDVHAEYSFHGTDESIKVVWKKTDIEYFDPKNPPAYFGGKWLTPAVTIPGMYHFVSESNNIIRFYYCEFYHGLHVFRLVRKLEEIRGKPFDFLYIVFITGRRVFGSETIHPKPEPAHFIKDPIDAFRLFSECHSEYGLSYQNVAVATVEPFFRPIEESDGEIKSSNTEWENRNASCPLRK